MFLFQTMSCADSSLPSRMTLTSRWARYMQLFQLQRLQIQRLQILLFTLSCQNMDLIGPGTGRPHDKPHLITVMQHYQSTQQQCFTMCHVVGDSHGHIQTYMHTSIHIFADIPVFIMFCKLLPMLAGHH